MSNSVFPTLRGIAWPVKKTPRFNTKVQQAVDLSETRLAFAPYPQWRWSLAYNVLRSDATNLEYQTLLNFYLSRQGSFDSFLFNDVTDNAVTDQVFAVSTGATTPSYQLLRTEIVNGFAEYIYDLNGAAVIKDNGVVKTLGVDYTISNGLVTFLYSPTTGHSLTWTGQYYWRVRFAEDTIELANFATAFWSLGQIAFLSVIGS